MAVWVWAVDVWCPWDEQIIPRDSDHSCLAEKGEHRRLD